MSGIVPTAECIDLFNAMKLKRKDLNFIIYKIENDEKVIVEDSGKCAYSEFMTKFPENECRYAVVEPPASKKLVFILWASQTATVKDRTIYASSKNKLVEQLLGLSKTVQAYCQEDLAAETIMNQLK